MVYFFLWFLYGFSHFLRSNNFFMYFKLISREELVQFLSYFEGFFWGSYFMISAKSWVFKISTIIILLALYSVSLLFVLSDFDRIINFPLLKQRISQSVRINKPFLVSLIIFQDKVRLINRNRTCKNPVNTPKLSIS